MGSHQNTQTHSKTSTDNTTNMEVTGIDPYKEQFANTYGQLQNNFTSLLANRPNLSMFHGFSSTLDPLVQNQVAQGMQNLNAADTAANQELSNRLSVAGTGSNGALLAALQRTAQMTNAGNRNALIPAALQAQRDMDVQKQQIFAQQNSQQMQNYANNIQALAPGMQLLQAIQGMAGTAAGKKVTEKGTTETNGTSYTQKGWF